MSAQQEVRHDGLTRLVVVETMHDRKRRMTDLADAFIMLPGGFRTLEEFSEVLTWTQLGVHGNPCSVLDVDGCFHHLLLFLDQAVAEGFVRIENRELIEVDTDPEALITTLDSWQRASGET